MLSRNIIKQSFRYCSEKSFSVCVSLRDRVRVRDASPSITVATFLK